MDETNAEKTATSQVLSTDEVGAVAGGDGSCTTTVTFSAPGTTVQSTYNSFGDALIGTYDGLVDATSHIIETVATSTR